MMILFVLCKHWFLQQNKEKVLNAMIHVMYISCSLLQPKHFDICVNIEFMINTVKNYCLLNESIPLNFAGQLILHFQIYSECCLSLILEESLRKMKKKIYKKLPLFFQYNFLKACLFEYWYMWLLTACHSYVNVAHTIIFLIYRAWSGILCYYS